ncbi:hypothetical protein Tco_0460994 [Tanacetum coccineum]
MAVSCRNKLRIWFGLFGVGLRMISLHLLLSALPLSFGHQMAKEPSLPLISERGRLAKDKEIELWVELKMLFEQDAENFLELQKDMHDPLNWWLYDTCAVHHVSTKKGQDIFMLVEKDYPLTKGLATLMLVNKLRVDQDSEMEDELLKKIYNIANIQRN